MAYCPVTGEAGGQTLGGEVILDKKPTRDTLEIPGRRGSQDRAAIVTMEGSFRLLLSLLLY